MEESKEKAIILKALKRNQETLKTKLKGLETLQPKPIRKIARYKAHLRGVEAEIADY